MHSIDISSSGALQATNIEQPLAEATNSVSQYERVQIPTSNHRGIFRTHAKETNSVWYHGFFGRVDIQSKSTSLSPSKKRTLESSASSEEKTIRITPLFLRKTLELQFLNSFGRISRTLTTYPILESGAPIFRLCEQGDIDGLQVALSSSTVSPFVLDERGWTLLHVSSLARSVECINFSLTEVQHAAWGQCADVCALLLQLGVNPDHEDQTGQ